MRGTPNQRQLQLHAGNTFNNNNYYYYYYYYYYTRRGRIL